MGRHERTGAAPDAAGTERGVNLVQLLLVVPVCAVVAEDEITVHALDADGVNASDWPDGEHFTACGEPVAAVIPDGDTQRPALWPCPARLPEGFVRCRECWVATGKKRPRSQAEVAA